MSTRTSTEGDLFILDGRKMFTSNGPTADLFVVYARTGTGQDFRGITAFIVEQDTPGFTVGQPVEKMGLKTSPFCELTFDRCKVPGANVLGRPGSGFFILEHVRRQDH